MKLIVALTCAALIAGPVLAGAQCRDPKTGHAAKCGKGMVAFSADAVTKDKTGRCHVAAGAKKGQLVKCP